MVAVSVLCSAAALRLGCEMCKQIKVLNLLLLECKKNNSSVRIIAYILYYYYDYYDDLPKSLQEQQPEAIVYTVFKLRVVVDDEEEVNKVIKVSKINFQ